MIVRVALKSMVEWEKTEFEIVGAVADGEAALRAVEQLQPHILVTDLKMPHLDGLGVAKRLYESGWPGKIIVLSSYGEFELAREAMRFGVSDYLLKASFNSDDLLKALRNVASSLPSGEAQNTAGAERDVISAADMAGALHGAGGDRPFQHKYQALYVYRKDIFSHMTAIGPDGSKEMLASLVGECIGARHNASVFSIAENCAVVLYPAADGLPEIVERDAEKISNSVRMYMNSQAGFVLSGAFSTLGRMGENLRACKAASRLSLYFGYGGVLRQEELDAYANPLDRDVFSSIDGICDCLAAGRYQKAHETVRRILEGFAPNHIRLEDATQYIKTLFERVTLSYSFYFEKNKEKLRELSLRYEECSTIGEYNVLCGEIIEEIRRSPIKTDESRYRSEVVDIIAYIKNNIDKKITLAQLSCAVNMAESYISRLFKNETGTNLTSYINMLKMERAMELLKNPHIFIKQAAAALGYDDQSYFNRIFNKYVGVSPNEFKRSQAGGGDRKTEQEKVGER